MAGLFGLCLLIILIAKVFLGTESKAYSVIFCVAFAGLAVSLLGIIVQVRS